jgi:phosphate transport system substrate-binding protein
LLELRGKNCTITIASEIRRIIIDLLDFVRNNSILQLTENPFSLKRRSYMIVSSKRATMRFARLCLFAALSGSLVMFGCGKKSASEQKKKAAIQVKGSDTMVNVAQAWAEAYKKVNPDVDVEVSGGGSGVGIAALEKGTIDIANASRNIKKEEAELAKKNTGKDPKEFVVGFDALAIYVHKDNPLEEISIEQLAKIYAEGGTMTKWSELGVKIPGGADDNIVRVSRQSSSGTYEFFRDHVLSKKDFKLGSRDMNGSKEVVELISSTKTAIGFSGMGYATPGVKMLKVSAKAGETASPPTVENTISKKYPLARSLMMYTLGEPTGAVKAYIDWILSDAGEEILKESGYVPNPKMAAAQ